VTTSLAAATRILFSRFQATRCPGFPSSDKPTGESRKSFENKGLPGAWPWRGTLSGLRTLRARFLIRCQRGCGRPDPAAQDVVRTSRGPRLRHCWGLWAPVPGCQEHNVLMCRPDSGHVRNFLQAMELASQSPTSPRPLRRHPGEMLLGNRWPVLSGVGMGTAIGIKPTPNLDPDSDSDPDPGGLRVIAALWLIAAAPDKPKRCGTGVCRRRSESGSRQG
jgi:hypothetical protein